VFECGGNRRPAGRRHHLPLASRRPVENWSIVEPPVGEPPLSEQSSDPIDPDDPDLHAALELRDIELA
jgi:hypothetical protein